MDIKREIIIYHSEKKKEISILPTDTEIMIFSKIKVAVNEKKPNFVFFPIKFSIEKLKNDKNYHPVILDLEILPILELQETIVESKTVRKIVLYNEIMEEIKNLFAFKNKTIYDYLLFRIVLTEPYLSSQIDTSKISIKKIPGMKEQDKKEAFRKKREARIEYNERIRKKNEKNAKLVHEKYLVPFNVIVSEENKKDIVRIGLPYIRIIIDFLNTTKSFVANRRNFNINEVIEYKYNETLKMIDENKKNIQSSKDAFEYFTSLPNKLSTETQFLGRVYDIHLKTKHYTTGILFDNLELNEYIPIAHYKEFFKLYKNYSCLKTHTQENDNLYILRSEDNGENTVIYCENTNDGLYIQVLLLSNSFIDTLDSVYTFLNIDKELIQITSTKQKGILGEFEIKNASFFSPIISDMIINGSYRVNDFYSSPLFSSFISLNDSDKISKDNNNIYIYYKTLHTNYSSKGNIMVGGWNKDSSRFGDLTATLNPLKREDEYFINVRIHRVYNENIINEFKFVLGKLLSLYERFEGETMQIYNSFFSNQEYYRNIRPGEYPDIILPDVNSVLKKIMESKVSSKVGSLGYENKSLFPGEYVRVCQPTERKPILFKNENNIDTLNLTNDEKEKSVLVYPRIEKTFKNSILRPNYYYCKNNEYPYVGYVEIKKLNEEHPFGGYAPCCFKRPQFKNNKKVEKFLYESEAIEKDTKITGYKIKKNKIIEQTGQMGELPAPIKSFFTSIEPRLNFVRVGIKNEYATSSLLYCCEYAIIYEKDVNIELKKNLRQDILREKNGSNPLELISQENVVHGTQFIRNVLENDRNFINVRHVFRLVQDYFHVNIIIFNIQGEIVRPNSMFNYKAILYDKEPFIILLEHDNPKRYELVGVEKDKKLEFCSFHKNLHFYNQLVFIYCQSLQIKENNNIFPIISFTDYQMWKTKLKNTKMVSQVLNKTGQCCAIQLKYNNKTIIPVVLHNSLPPFDVEQKFKINVPLFQEVETFLEDVFPSKKLETLHVNKKYGYFLVNKEFCFPFLYDESVNYTGENTFHPFLFLVEGAHSKLKKFDNFLGCYTLINIMKDYLLNLFGKYIHENSIPKDENYKNVIQNFKKDCIEFVKGREYNVDYLSCLKSENRWMFQGKKLKLPKDLDTIIDYYLHWNYECNYEELKKYEKGNELEYFYFTNQFSRKLGNNVQLTRTAQENINYNPYFDFDLSKNHNYTFEERVLYYHYDYYTSNIRPFFIINKRDLTNDDRYSIYSIIDNYYKKKQFTFTPNDHVRETEYMDKVDIITFPHIDEVIEEVNLPKKRKKRKDIVSNESSEEDFFKKTKKDKFRMTMILFHFL